MIIHESAENYLETILILKQSRNEIRSIDIVHHLDISKPSVSRAMALLKEGGYITVSKEGFIDFTENGLIIATRMYERHQLMTDWLISIGVSPKVAAEDACKIEHDISEETFEKIKLHIDKN